MFPFKRRKATIPQESKQTYHYSSESSTEEQLHEMSSTLTRFYQSCTNDIVYLCVGSDRSTGDSFGPFVGTMLKEKRFPYQVFGTIEEPVHALNLVNVVKNINKQFSNPTIISIDASLGDYHQIGTIILKEGPLIPGFAVRNSLPEVGNYHLKAVVNYLDPSLPISSLNSTRLHMVMNLAKITTDIILNSVNNRSNVKMAMNQS